MKRIKQIFALVLSVLLTAAFYPSVAYAEEIRDDGVSKLIIGHSGCTHDLSELLNTSSSPDTSTCHTHVMSSWMYDSDINAKSGDGWSYDVGSRTLTLDSYNGSGFWFDGSSTDVVTLTVKLIGDNTVTGLQNGSEPSNSYYAMSGAWADWDIQGPGSLTVSAFQGINPTIIGGDGLLRISNGAVININTYRVGLAADEMIIDSGCVVIANTSNTDETAHGFGMSSPVGTTHTRCNGTLITTNAHPERNGIESAAFLTAGSNVTLFCGTSSADATAQTIPSMPSEEYGADTGRFYIEDAWPYMAMIEAGYNGSAAGTTPSVTAPTTPITTLPAAVPSLPITTPPVTAPVSPAQPTTPTAPVFPIFAAQPTVPAQSSMTVMPTPSKVFVNGMEKSFEAYNIDDNNYFKLRDIAFALNDTAKQFNLSYDNATAAINILPGSPYIPAGGEMTAGDGQAKTATLTLSKIYLNGNESPHHPFKGWFAELRPYKGLKTLNLRTRN